MSASDPSSPVSTVAVPTPATPKLDPVTVLFALGSDVRWPLIRQLADGRRLAITEAAALVRRDPDAVSRQLKVLADAGVVTALAGQDRRQTLYEIPAAFRTAPGVLDFGFCVLKLDQL